jgi:hypothetical protein
MPRCAGVTAARNLLCGANAPWNLAMCMRGGGTNAANRANDPNYFAFHVGVNGAVPEAECLPNLNQNLPSTEEGQRAIEERAKK